MPKVSAKKKCCKDKPRCQACPVTLKRLADGGHADKTSSGTYVLPKKLPKGVLVAARAR